MAGGSDMNRTLTKEINNAVNKYITFGGLFTA
jgi:hypothetical protein